jgi:SnoaL-like protein
MADESAIRDALLRHWQTAGIDEDAAAEIYHDDAVLEFPQSGERFVGLQSFLAWRKQYPAKLDFRVRRITSSGELWVCENLISYDGSPWSFTVNILEFHGDKVRHERVYVMDGWEAAPWRAEWAENFDPVEAITPSDWRDSAG